MQKYPNLYKFNKDIFYMVKTALITGITGQDGSYLAEFLLNKGYKVYGLIRRVSTPNYTNIKHILDRIEIIDGDLTDPSSLNNAIIKSKPDEIYNLAAQSFVAISWKEPQVTTEIDALGTLNLLEALKNFAPKAKFYQASTSEMYGNSNENGKQDEKTPFHPRSPYAIAKLYSYWISRNYRESYGLFICNGILFNHESPRRGIEFVTRKITDGVARIKLGLADSISLGNLEARRDWGFAGDYVKAMWLMLQQEEPEDYVVATGETHSVKEFVQEAFNAAGISNWEDYIKQNPEFMRPSDVQLLQGVPDKAIKSLGWKPEVSFKELVKMMVELDIERIKSEQ
jgi:GDPmannose 4,6-dehydratase